ncbi:protein Wnt-16 [Callorhinchus milii]|uniref:Protein Wnt n=1 Tax=Callorhinchus milii TaxID=7868 RepID=A0A4W3I6S7_CALMI|nr:protein Wnt-16 [Callorhinchus milii]|eukprot:gi/632973457/ref/XP_007903164.1/ PREDICTED: protein Wnt-16 [Callorhinchus milii]
MEKPASFGLSRLCLLFAVIITVFPCCSQGNWMWLGVAACGATEKMDCVDLPLSSKQKELCKRKPSLLPSIKEGARIGIYECQSQFKHERWNCSVTDDFSVFGYELTSGTKESAFIQAAGAAALVHSLTRACSAGNLTECSCDTRLQGGGSASEGWHWEGCSDNIQYGTAFSRKFLDAHNWSEAAKERDAVGDTMSLHNNEAGRQAVARLMAVNCRCHGVSGSCAVKTCWKTTSPFDKIGSFLKEKYENSIQIQDRSKRKVRRKDKVRRKVPVEREDLVYIKKSPNYCVEDRSAGIAGTRGRQCNRTSHAADGCNLLCCGRGYNTHVVRHVERCDCKFVWCCYVRCRKCETMTDVHTCK